MNPLRGYAHFADDATPMTKLLIGSVLLFAGLFVPFVCHFAVMGFMAMTVRTTIRGEKGLAPLDWDFDLLIYYVILGAESTIVLLLWSIPFTLLAIVVVVCGGVMSVLTTAVAQLPPFALAISIVVGFALSVAVIVLGALPGHVAAMRVMITGDAEEGFAVTEIFRFTLKYFFPLAIGLFITWVVGIPLTILGVLACFIGALPAYILTHVSSNDVLTQVYLRSLEEGATPLPLGDDPPRSV